MPSANRQLFPSHMACECAGVCESGMLHVKAGFALSRSIVAHVSEYCAFVCRYLAATPSRREAAMAESAVFGNASLRKLRGGSCAPSKECDEFDDTEAG